jgi:hypothetical protein
MQKIARDIRMPNTRKNKRGGGYQTSQQMFDPDVLPPATMFAAPSSAPTDAAVRPVLLATYNSPLFGGSRKHRGAKGGFSPSVMGGFMANAQAAIVPLALYALYRTVVPTAVASRKNTNGGKRRNTRNRK